MFVRRPFIRNFKFPCNFCFGRDNFTFYINNKSELIYTDKEGNINSFQLNIDYRDGYLIHNPFEGVGVYDSSTRVLYHFVNDTLTKLIGENDYLNLVCFDYTGGIYYEDIKTGNVCSLCKGESFIRVKHEILLSMQINLINIMSDRLNNLYIGGYKFPFVLKVSPDNAINKIEFPLHTRDIAHIQVKSLPNGWFVVFTDNNVKGSLYLINGNNAILLKQIDYHNVHLKSGDCKLLILQRMGCNKITYLEYRMWSPNNHLLFKKIVRNAIRTFWKVNLRVCLPRDIIMLISTFVATY